jgi:GT2 family glycosyltransferase
MTNTSPSRVGLVAIGRNEGERLRTCLDAALRQQLPVVYVDSGSTDGSAELAARMGADVVPLDMSIPFTAARARNEGARRLVERHPGLTHIQFVDGDCELQPGFIAKALRTFEQHPRCAVVCGRRRERFPQATVYNRLCDIEWDTPLGVAQSCGGDALFRREVFERVGGFNGAIIAGEEPDLCFRIRQLGLEIHRIDAEMTLHDAAMTRFSQWWKRNLRAGHAFAEGNARNGGPPEHFWLRNVRSNYVWALLLPLWPVLWCKLLMQRKGLAYATFTTLSKLPQALGQWKYHANARQGRQARIIEYK